MMRHNARPLRRSTLKQLLIGAGLVASLAILLTVFALVQLSLRAENDADSRVLNSQTVVGDLDRLLSQLKDAETGQRGYLITGDRSFAERSPSA